MQKTCLFILFIIAGFKLSAQVDTTRADSLILQQLFTNQSKNDSITKIEATGDTIRELPADKQLLEYFAQKGVPFDSLCSQVELYREVYGWIGVRYRYAGLTKKGVDCAGFVKNVCNRVYGTGLSGSARDHFKKCIPLEREDLEEGDLVFFKIKQSQISHIGLYLGDGKFVHASVKGGVMINDLSETYYNKYYYLGGRLINAPKKTYGQ